MATINWSLQHKRDTAANWTANNPTLLAGQIGIETDNLTTTPKFKIGDGSTAWNALPYFYGGALSAQNLSNVLSVGNTTGNNDIIQTGTSVLRNNDSSCFLDLATSGFLELYSTDGLYKYYVDSDATSQYVEMKTEDVATQTELSYFQSIPLQTNIGVFSAATGNRLTQLEVTNGEIKTNIVNNLTFAGIKYNADFSANYTNRSLVDKGYVDGQLSSYLTTANAALTYQPLDSDLTSWAGVTRASGFDTFTATPSSANLASLVTDETGSGSLVFGTQPTFTQWITVPRIYGGTSVNDGIDFYSTSGNGTSSAVAHRFLGGNNGATTILTMLNDGTIRIPNNRNIQGVDSGGTNRNLITWSSGDNITITGRPGVTDINLNPTSGGIGLYVKSGGDGGIGVASPSARWHIIKTTEQLRVGYDTSNYYSTTVGSTGNTIFSLNAATSGASVSFSFNIPTNTGQTASTNIPNFRVNGSTKTWAAGTITNQYWNYFTANTAAFASASTITNSYGLYVEAATAGTNATITNNWALGGNGSFSFSDGTRSLNYTLAANSILNNTGDTSSQIKTTSGTRSINIQSYAGDVNYIDAANNTLRIRTTTNNAIEIWTNGTSRLGVSTTNLTFSDSFNMTFNGTTGTRIGTATTEKLSFWNATPIVQPTTSVAAATFVANTSGIANDTATFDGYTIGQVVKALRNIGLLA